MSKYSAEWLAQVIELLPSDEPVPKGTQGYNIYTTQKDHWLCWLDPNTVAVDYSRKDGPGRDARYAYNHIMEPKMLLWLISASGLPASALEKAKEEAHGKSAFASKCAAIRQAFPWEELAVALSAHAKQGA